MKDKSLPEWARERPARAGINGSIVLGIVAGLALAFLVLPVVVLVLRALGGGSLIELTSSAVANAVTLSLVTTLVTCLFTLLLGTPLAYLLARGRFRGRRLVTVLVELPIVLPPAVAGLALLLTFGRRGFFGPLLDSAGIALPFTTAAVVMAQAFVAAPLYVRAAQIGFAGVPREIEEAARVDGASGLNLFRHVTLPLTARALSAGIILCWARALGEFGATILFAGSLQGRTQTMPLLIYNVLERDLDAALVVGVLLVGLALAALVLSQWIVRRHDDPLPA